MVVTSRTPLFLMLVSFVLTALQGCGADCRAAVEESGLPYKKDGEDVEGTKECGFGGDDGTDAPGRLLEDSIENKFVGIEDLSKFDAIRAALQEAMEVHGRALEGHEMDAKQMQEMLKDTCKNAQKQVDCFGGKDQALCACTCKEIQDPEDEDADCKMKGGKDDKEEDMSDKTMKEIIDWIFIDPPGISEICKDAEGIDNSLSNPCDAEE